MKRWTITVEDGPVFYRPLTGGSMARARLVIDPASKEVWADTIAVGDAEYRAVWLGAWPTVTVSPYADGKAVREYLESAEAQALLEALASGDDNDRDHALEALARDLEDVATDHRRVIAINGRLYCRAPAGEMPHHDLAIPVLGLEVFEHIFCGPPFTMTFHNRDWPVLEVKANSLKHARWLLKTTEHDARKGSISEAELRLAGSRTLKAAWIWKKDRWLMVPVDLEGRVTVKRVHKPEGTWQALIAPGRSRSGWYWCRSTCGSVLRIQARSEVDAEDRYASLAAEAPEHRRCKKCWR